MEYPEDKEFVDKSAAEHRKLLIEGAAKARKASYSDFPGKADVLDIAALAQMHAHKEGRTLVSNMINQSRQARGVPHEPMMSTTKATGAVQSGKVLLSPKLGGTKERTNPYLDEVRKCGVGSEPESLE